jgi:TRAP-type C4-dicarboxylate transport system permease small subunit
VYCGFSRGSIRLPPGFPESPTIYISASCFFARPDPAPGAAGIHGCDAKGGKRQARFVRFPLRVYEWRRKTGSVPPGGFRSRGDVAVRKGNIFMLGRLKTVIDKVIGFILICMMTFLVCCVTWQVFSRYVLQMPSIMTDEMARFLLIWIALLGSAYVVGLQKHLNIDLVLLYLSGKARSLANLIINLLIGVFSLVVVVIGGIWLVRNVLASNQMASAMQFPIGYIYLILPFSGIIMVFYSLYFSAENIAALRQGIDAGTDAPGGN